MSSFQTAAEFYCGGLEGVEELDDNDLGFQVWCVIVGRHVFLAGRERRKMYDFPAMFCANTLLALGVFAAAAAAACDLLVFLVLPCHRQRISPCVLPIFLK